MESSNKAQLPPLIAFLTILDKQNHPVISRNYLTEFLGKQYDTNTIDPQVNIESLSM
jgi:hypothetical protein